MSTRPSPIAAIPALLLVIVACWETCATPRYASAVPGDKAWAKAAQIVREGYKPGDLIVFAPDWVRFAAATTPGPHDVTFILSANDSNRLICFTAEARQ